MDDLWKYKRELEANERTLKENQKKYNRNFVKENPVARERNLRQIQLYRARMRAEESGVEFDITTKDIEWVDTCPILGIALERGSGNRANSPSIDRVTPELGYIKGNVRVISNLANAMKQNASIDQLEAFSKNIMRYMKGEI